MSRENSLAMRIGMGLVVIGAALFVSMAIWRINYHSPRLATEGARHQYGWITMAGLWGAAISFIGALVIFCENAVDY